MEQGRGGALRGQPSRGPRRAGRRARHASGRPRAHGGDGRGRSRDGYVERPDRGDATGRFPDHRVLTERPDPRCAGPPVGDGRRRRRHHRAARGRARGEPGAQLPERGDRPARRGHLRGRRSERPHLHERCSRAPARLLGRGSRRPQPPRGPPLHAQRQNAISDRGVPDHGRPGGPGRHAHRARGRLRPIGRDARAGLVLGLELRGARRHARSLGGVPGHHGGEGGTGPGPRRARGDVLGRADSRGADGRQAAPPRPADRRHRNPRGRPAGAARADARQGRRADRRGPVPARRRAATR